MSVLELAVLPAWNAFSLAINQDLVFFVASLALAGAISLWGGRGARSRLAHMGAVMLVCFVLSLLLKPALGIPRPCAIGGTSLVPCPDEFSMPSSHAAVSFGLALSVVGLDIFPLALIWALLVSASRLYLGVHTLGDLEAGLAVAVLAMAVVEAAGIVEPVLRKRKPEGGRMAQAARPPPHAHDEFARKAVQAALGLLVVGYALALGADAAALPVAAVLVGGLMLFHLKHRDTGLPLIDAALRWMERPGEPAGYGALTFFAGMLAALSMLPQELAVSMVLVLSIADALSALAGQWAKKNGMHHHPLPHNPDKSYAGSLVFVLASLPVYLIAGWAGVGAALAAAAAESLPLPVDDNLLIPWAGIAFAIALKLMH